MSLFTILYVSSARAGLRAPDIGAIVTGAREFNGSCGVTGMLMHCDGSFMQALEGEEALLTTLYTRIRNDRRHSGVITVIAEPLHEREFSQWAMGFEDLRAPPTSATPHFSGIASSAASRGRSYRLLESFRNRVLRA